MLGELQLTSVTPVLGDPVRLLQAPAAGECYPPHADWNNNSNGRISVLLFALLLDLYTVVIKLSGKILRCMYVSVWYMYVKVLDT